MVLARDLERAILVIFGHILVATPLAAQQPVGEPVACLVSGYDVFLRNKSDLSLGAGGSIHWSVPFARASGTHVLENPLESGRTVLLVGALGSSYLEVGVPCTVDYIANS